MRQPEYIYVTKGDTCRFMTCIGVFIIFFEIGIYTLENKIDNYEIIYNSTDANMDLDTMQYKYDMMIISNNINYASLNVLSKDMSILRREIATIDNKKNMHIMNTNIEIIYIIH